MTTNGAQDFDDFLLLVGRLNYAWTNTESLLIHLIAGLARLDMETATVVFLTLNTARARMDLVKRLAKLPRIQADERRDVVAITERMQRIGQLRNRYNHCIYAFDANAELSHTILMRIVERRDDIRMGRVDKVDDKAGDGIRSAINDLQDTNRGFWSLIRTYGYPH